MYNFIFYPNRYPISVDAHKKFDSISKYVSINIREHPVSINILEYPNPIP